MDRSFDQGRRAPLRCLRGRILRAVLRRRALRSWHKRRYGGRSSTSIRNNGLLHMHEDGRNHKAQGRRLGHKAAGDHGDIHEYLAY